MSRPITPDSSHDLLIKELLLLILVSAPVLAKDISPERQDTLRKLLRQDCGACHGLTLKGGMGPALLPGSLSGKSDAFLAETILNGRMDTAMPPWRPFINHEEALWLIGVLRNPGR